MTYEYLLVQTQNDIVTISINRPKSLNALNKYIFNELEQFFKEDHKSFLNLKGIIITGSGEKAFVAGADIKEFLDLEQGNAASLSKRGQDVFLLIEKFHLPVIAVVNGFALGGGCELAMACHMRIGTERSKFGQPEVNLGLIPGYGGTQRLAQLVGKAKAIELILTGDMIDAQEAYRLGLVNHIVDSTEALDKAISIIEKISSKGPRAVAMSIAAINDGYDANINGYETEAKYFGKMMSSDEAKEGISAFLEKRKAQFRT